MTLAFALICALASSPEMPSAAPGWERGARERSSTLDADEERRLGHTQIGAAIGAAAAVVASIATAVAYEAQVNATVPPEQRNPDEHVTPVLLALFCIPTTAIAGGAVGAAVGYGFAALTGGPTVSDGAE